MLRRLSPGPTIPEMMRAESLAWRGATGQSLRIWMCFTGASFVLVMARVLLRLCLITPEYAAGAFALASCLTRQGLRAWQDRR